MQSFSFHLLHPVAMMDDLKLQQDSRYSVVILDDPLGLGCGEHSWMLSVKRSRLTSTLETNLPSAIEVFNQRRQSTLPAGKVPLMLGFLCTTGAPTGCDLPLGASPGQWGGPIFVWCKVSRHFQCLCQSSEAIVDTVRQCRGLGCQVC